MEFSDAIMQFSKTGYEKLYEVEDAENAQKHRQHQRWSWSYAMILGYCGLLIWTAAISWLQFGGSNHSQHELYCMAVAPTTE